MGYKIGTRLYCASSSTEVIVTRACSAEAELFCNGAPMLLADAGRDIGAGQPEEVLLGKRFVDTASGIEVLCVKAGAGPLTMNGTALEMRTAKPLPSSD